MPLRPPDAGLPLPRDGTTALRAIRLLSPACVRATAVCERAFASRLLISGLENQRHRPGKRLPLRMLGSKFSTAAWGQTIDPRAFSLVRRLPRGRDPTLGLQPMKCRIQRTCFDLEQVFGGSLDMLRDGVTVRGTSLKGAQNEQLERPLQKRHPCRGVAPHSVDRLLLLP